MKTTAVFVLLLLVCHVSADPEVLMRETAARLAKLEVEVAFLRDQTQAKQVAFSASLSPGGEMTVGPLPDNTILIFKNVPTNIGDAYNPETGVFTAPVKGTYQFLWHVVGHGSAPSAFMLKNNVRTFCAWEDQTSGHGAASQSITLPLEAGDTMALQLWAGFKVWDNQHRHTTFSGHMLFPM